MKPAIFKKEYRTETDFAPEDLIQFITEALNGVHANFKEKNQYDNLFDDSNRPLIDIFRDENYKLEYLGLDSLNNYHLFNITNDVKTVEIIMKTILFQTHFQVV